jgi:hypothetical protein
MNKMLIEQYLISPKMRNARKISDPAAMQGFFLTYYLCHY